MMPDDIVTRLRGKEHGTDDNRCEACDGFCCHCELCDCCLEILEVCLEAADEIERLRAFADHLAEAADIDRVRLMSRIIALEIGVDNE